MVTLVFEKHGVTRSYRRKVVCEESLKDDIISVWVKRGFTLVTIQFQLNF